MNVNLVDLPHLRISRPAESNALTTIHSVRAYRQIHHEEYIQFNQTGKYQERNVHKRAG